LRVDLRGTEVRRRGNVVYLSARELQLLRYFVEHPEVILSREEIMKEVWNYGASTFTRTVDVQGASVRQKLEDDPRRPQRMLTIPGLGHRFAG